MGEHTFERKWNSIWKMAEEKRAEDENENTREIHAKAAMAKVKRRNCVSFLSFLSFPSILNDGRKNAFCVIFFIVHSSLMMLEKKKKKKRAFSFFFSFVDCRLDERAKPFYSFLR